MYRCKVHCLVRRVKIPQYLSVVYHVQILFPDLKVDTVVHDKDALQANISWKSTDLGGELLI